MTRETIYEAINKEREFQDKKWGGVEHDRYHEVAGWITYMQHYMNKAVAAVTNNDTAIPALEEIRKVVALGVACFEIWGVPTRTEKSDHANQD